MSNVYTNTFTNITLAPAAVNSTTYTFESQEVYNIPSSRSCCNTGVVYACIICNSSESFKPSNLTCSPADEIICSIYVEKTTTGSNTPSEKFYLIRDVSILKGMNYQFTNPITIKRDTIGNYNKLIVSIKGKNPQTFSAASVICSIVES